MPRVNLSRVSTTCKVPGCTTPIHPGPRNPLCWRLERHHLGCEAMFVRHFERRAGQPRYDDFRQKYYEFRPEDCETLCTLHHEEVHEFYWPELQRQFKKIKKPVCRWSWRQADFLIQRLRRMFYLWLEAKAERPMLKLTSTMKLVVLARLNRKEKTP